MESCGNNDETAKILQQELYRNVNTERRKYVRIKGLFYTPWPNRSK